MVIYTSSKYSVYCNNTKLSIYPAAPNKDSFSCIGKRAKEVVTTLTNLALIDNADKEFEKQADKYLTEIMKG